MDADVKQLLGEILEVLTEILGLATNPPREVLTRQQAQDLRDRLRRLTHVVDGS